MSRTYNNIYDTDSDDILVNKNGEENPSFVYGDLQERVQVVNAKSINSNTAYVSVSENNAVRVDVRRVPNKFTVVDANDGKVSTFDGSSAIQVIVPAVITSIAYGISPANNVPYMGAVKGEHYIDFTYGSGIGYYEHVYISLKPIQDIINTEITNERNARVAADDVLQQNIDAEERRATQAEELLQTNIDTEIARAESAESRLNDALGDEVARATGTENSLRTNINTINSYIMAGTDSDNQLANKDFVNSSIQNMAAFYVTYDAQGNPFPTKQALVNSTQVYIDGQARASIGHNDYCIVLADESKHEVSGDPTTRYIYQGTLDEPYDASKWGFQYVINNSGLTAEQLAAINSGITSGLVQQFSGYEQGKQDTLVSGENIKTINNTSILGSGNFNLQETLVSGTNIKTINGSSILGSGDIEITGVTDYDKLTDRPIVNQDLLDPEFEPQANESYRHTGLAFSQSCGEFISGEPISAIHFDTNKSVDEMNAILDDFVINNTPLMEDSGIKGYAFLSIWGYDESEDKNKSFVVPLLRVTPQDVAESMGIETDHDVYTILSDANAETPVFSNVSSNGTTAGWQTDHIDFTDAQIISLFVQGELEKFAGTSTTQIVPNRIYVYKDDKYILGDYDEIVNTPITNADFSSQAFEPEDGKYYRNTKKIVRSTATFEDGKFYNKICLSRPDANRTLDMFNYLETYVEPDYVSMKKGSESPIRINYAYIQDYRREGYDVVMDDDGKPQQFWWFINIQLDATRPAQDLAHWKKITVSAWDSTQTYSAGDVVTKDITVGAETETHYYESLLDDNLNQDPESSSSYWQEIQPVEWNGRTSYALGTYVTQGSLYKCISAFTYTPDSLPVRGGDSNFATLWCSLADGQKSIWWQSILTSIWASTNILTSPAFTWAGQQGHVLSDVNSLAITAPEDGDEVIRTAKVFTHHQDVWADFFSPEEFEVIDRGIYRKEEDGLKELITEVPKELPEIKKDGQVLTSSCLEYPIIFTKVGNACQYEATAPNDVAFAFNVDLDSTELRTALDELHNAVGADFWQLTFNPQSSESSADYTDIYFVRDTLHTDSDGFSAFLIAGKIRNDGVIEPIYSNYAQTYVVDAQSVEVVSTGWFIESNEFDYRSDSVIVSYLAPAQELSPDTYGKIITKIIVDADYNKYAVFYGDVVEAKPIWKDISIPEGGGVPDYSEAKDGDTLRVSVTPAQIAFVPPVASGQVLTGVYVEPNSMPGFFGDYETNSTVDGLPSTRAIRVLVNGTRGGTADSTLYVSIELVQHTIGGADIPYILLSSQTSLESSPSFLGSLYAYFPPYMTGWEMSAVVDDGTFYEVITKTVEGLGFTNYTLTVESVFEQDKWRSWMGISKTVEEVVPASKSIGWGSPYPEITEAGQVLTSDCETFSFDFTRNSSNDYRCSVDSSGRLYFNTDLTDDQVQTILISYLDYYGGSQSLKQWMFWAKNSSDTRLLPYWGFISGDNNAYAIVAIDNNGIHQIWANIDGDFTISGQSVGLNCHVGWDLENIEAYTSWADASYLQYTSPNSLISSSDYGQIISLQDGIFYGQIGNVKTKWANVDLSKVNVDTSNIPMFDESSATPNSIMGLPLADSNKVVRYGSTSVKSWLNVGATNGTFTVYSNTWSASGDDYIATVTISGLTDDCGLIVSPTAPSAAKSAQEANIYFAYSSGTTLYLYCTDKPLSSIAFNYTIVR